MTAVSTPPGAAASSEPRLIRVLPGFGFGLAVLAGLLMLAAPLGWRLGWWHFRVAFWSILAPAAWIALAAAIVSLVALVLGFVRGRVRRFSLVGSVAGLVLGGVLAWYPWSYYSMVGKLPSIHDISTDTETPPEFQAVLPARETEHAATAVWAGPELAAQQKAAYPDIAPAILPVPPAEAFQRALDTAKARGLVIVASDPAAGRIEASQTSRWFHFTDDCVLRIRPEGAGSRVDMRCLSRQGRGDFGVNAARIRGYMAALKAAALKG